MIEENGAAHLTLFDTREVNSDCRKKLGGGSEEGGATAAMVGGSTSTSIYQLDAIVRAIKSSKLPVILFPNDVVGLSQYADAVFFMSLLNSTNPHYLSGAQALGAPLVKRYGLEPIPIAYLSSGNIAARQDSLEMLTRFLTRTWSWRRFTHWPPNTLGCVSSTSKQVQEPRKPCHPIWQP